MKILILITEMLMPPKFCVKGLAHLPQPWPYKPIAVTKILWYHVVGMVLHVHKLIESPPPQEGAVVISIVHTVCLRHEEAKMTSWGVTNESQVCLRNWVSQPTRGADQNLGLQGPLDWLSPAWSSVPHKYHVPATPKIPAIIKSSTILCPTSLLPPQMTALKGANN